MKPRRENGAIFVSPMTSDVSCGSALMLDSPGFVWLIQQTNAAERKSPPCEDRKPCLNQRRYRGSEREKEQGRRRSIPPTALPAPDIKIGLRHPVNYRLPRERRDK